MSTLDLVHLWFAAVCFGTAILGLGAMLIGFSLPARSKKGGVTFTFGLVSAVGAVAVYLVYLVATVVAVAVMRS